MKISIKLLVLWVASLVLFTSAGIATWMGMALMEGLSGLMIRFFLGYCSIIVVAQAFTTIAELRQFFREATPEQAKSIRVLLG